MQNQLVWFLIGENLVATCKPYYVETQGLYRRVYVIIPINLSRSKSFTSVGGWSELKIWYLQDLDVVRSAAGHQRKDTQQKQLMKTKILKGLLKPKAVEKRFRKWGFAWLFQQTTLTKGCFMLFWKNRAWRVTRMQLTFRWVWRALVQNYGTCKAIFVSAQM